MSEESLLESVCNRVKSDKERLENKQLGKIEVDSFNLTDFWSQFGAIVQALSNEVTKVCFMCGKKPFPKMDELNSMLQDLMQYYNLMKELFMVLPEGVGKTVYDGVWKAFLDIISALLAVVNSLYDLTDKGAKERLALTGTFWDACNAVESLPKNNLSATLKVLEEQTALATDAKEELQTTIEEDRDMGDLDSDERWTDEERELATKAVGLVKVTQLCLQRLLKSVREYGNCESSHHIAQLDDIATVVRAVSPTLDDFVSELYHPVDIPTAVDNAGKLATVLRSMLSTTKETHYSEGINKDIDKLLVFISHNHSKLDPSVTDTLPALASLSIS